MANPAYLSTSVGKALVDSLTELSEKDALPTDVAAQTVREFSKAMDEELANMASVPKLFAKGNIDCYQYADGRWKLKLDEPRVVLRKNSHKVDSLTVEAIDPDGKK